MVISEQYLKDYFKDGNNLFFLWTKDCHLDLDKESFTLDYLSVFITLSGSIDFKTNMHVLRAASPDILFFNPHESVSVIEASEDVVCVGIIFSKKYWNHTLLHSHPALTLSMVHPCLEVNDDQCEIFLYFWRLIRQLKTQGTPDNHAVIVNLILGMLFHIGRAYEKWSLYSSKEIDNTVVAGFIELLYENYKTHRDVNFYAEKLNLSKSRFSEIIKKSIGMTPFQCIERYTIFKICSQLKSTEKSIKELSFEYNFADDSHLCKFFRKFMGQSPMDFRNEVMYKSSVYPGN